MRKLLTLVCLCLLFTSSAFSKPLSDYYAKEAVGALVLGIEDAKYLFGLTDQETATTKVTKEVISTLKDKFSIDLEKDLEQIGVFVVPCSEENGTQVSLPSGETANIAYEPVLLFCGKFDSSKIMPALKNLIASEIKEASQVKTLDINNKKINALIAKEYRLLFFADNMILFCRDKAVSLMQKNKLTFSKAPMYFEGLQERSNSFIFVRKPLTNYLENLKLPIAKLETIESLSAYITKDYIYGEAGFNDDASAKTMLNNVDKFKDDFYEQQTKGYELAKSNLMTAPLENIFDVINVLYSAAKNKDIVNRLKYYQKGCSIVFQQPYDRDDKLVMAFGGIGILAAAAVPNFKAARGSAREKACFSNQRVLTGAVEMYNMDHSTMMSTLDIPTLVKEGYLKAAPSKPEPDCDYFSKGDLATDGCIFCKKHGSVMHQH